MQRQVKVGMRIGLGCVLDWDAYWIGMRIVSGMALATGDEG